MKSSQRKWCPLEDTINSVVAMENASNPRWVKHRRMQWCTVATPSPIFHSPYWHLKNWHLPEGSIFIDIVVYSDFDDRKLMPVSNIGLAETSANWTCRSIWKWNNNNNDNDNNNNNNNNNNKTTTINDNNNKQQQQRNEWKEKGWPGYDSTWKEIF